jgi:hypothetical protein
VAVVVSVVAALWGLVAGISWAVCSDYNFLSNDFCDRWHYDPPPESALPVPPGWDVRWTRLDCGSGGCPTRLYVLVPPQPQASPASLYLDAIRRSGWQVDAHGLSRKGSYRLRAAAADDRVWSSLVPPGLRRHSLVYVDVMTCGEAIGCD